MAKKKEGVTDRVLECAKEEFLKKGYYDASLRTIAKKANTATGSIYTRFGDKAGIFRALVYPVVKDIEQWFSDEQEKYSVSLVKKDWPTMLEHTNRKYDEMLNYIYENFDTLKLLVQGSQGTEFYNFIQRLADIHTEYTIRYLDDVNNDAVCSGRVSSRLIHMLFSAFYTALLETVVYDIPKKEADIYYRQLQLFFNNSWEDLLLNK